MQKNILIVTEMLDLVQLGEFGKRRPHQLSGGQRQRVALARCLVKHPRVVLLDEPLAALDRKLREQTQFELVRIQKQVGITFVMVTHDQEEAMAMSTRIAVMNKGRVLQVGRPHDIYEYPANRFVADFIGEANMFEGVAEGEGLRVADLECPLALEKPLAAGTSVVVMVRPEKIAMSRDGDGAGANRFAGEVAEIGYHGGVSSYRVRVGAERLVRVTSANRRHHTEPAVERGDRVVLSWHPANAVVLP